MNNSLQRLFLILVLAVLFIGATSHLYLSSGSTAHITQESSCVIHGLSIQPEKPSPSANIAGFEIGDLETNAHALSLKNKISHPPTL